MHVRSAHPALLKSRWFLKKRRFEKNRRFEKFERKNRRFEKFLGYAIYDEKYPKETSSE
jgi:hypothetical protein